MPPYTVRPLGPDTWDAYAALIERHKGVWGGCWCLAFHPKYPERGQSPEGNRALKRRLVDEGLAHAAVVFDVDQAVGWCQFGTPAELPSIYHRKELRGLERRTPGLPHHLLLRGPRPPPRGVSAIALQGALDLIACAGGGVVEGYPQDTAGTKVSASFLYNGTRSLFEGAGFTFDRPKGKHHCVVRTTVDPW